MSSVKADDITMTPASKPVTVRPSTGGFGKFFAVGIVFIVLSLVVSIATLALVVDLKTEIDVIKETDLDIQVQLTEPEPEVSTVVAALSAEATIALGPNVCEGKKPYHSDAEGTDEYFLNTECMIDGVIQVLEQAGANVTEGYQGDMDATGRTPIVEPYWKMGLCPVNVHWHLGAEHFSAGEFDDHGSSPGDAHRRHLLAGEVREGFNCHHYDEADAKYTTEYNWQHCVDMHVGETYEVHWPHSAAGACGTPNQYQTPFYDGVFCTDGIITLSPLNTFEKIGVQGQVFTIVNDESYYYPDLIRGMIVDGDMGADIAKYTGSTTGTSRDNTICSKYTPITWQVDRKCHLISASSFDKMCADMKAQRDDMTDDLHAHGSRELVADHLAADNHQR